MHYLVAGRPTGRYIQCTKISYTDIEKRASDISLTRLSKGPLQLGFPLVSRLRRPIAEGFLFDASSLWQRTLPFPDHQRSAAFLESACGRFGLYPPDWKVGSTV